MPLMDDTSLLMLYTLLMMMMIDQRSINLFVHKQARDNVGLSANYRTGDKARVFNDDDDDADCTGYI